MTKLRHSTCCVRGVQRGWYKWKKWWCSTECWQILHQGTYSRLLRCHNQRLGCKLAVRRCKSTAHTCPESGSETCPLHHHHLSILGNKRKPPIRQTERENKKQEWNLTRTSRQLVNFHKVLTGSGCSVSDGPAVKTRVTKAHHDWQQQEQQESLHLLIRQRDVDCPANDLQQVTCSQSQRRLSATSFRKVAMIRFQAHLNWNKVTNYKCLFFLLGSPPRCTLANGEVLT